MQIILEENEIMEALDKYCSSCITIPEGKKIKVEFTVGRGTNGTKATIDFEDIISIDPVKASKLKDSMEQVNEIIDTTVKEPTPDSKPKQKEDSSNSPVFDTSSEESESTDKVPSGDSLFNL